MFLLFGRSHNPFTLQMVQTSTKLWSHINFWRIFIIQEVSKHKGSTVTTCIVLETFTEKTHNSSNYKAPQSGLKVNDQLVTSVTRFLAVRLKKYVWSHHRALKAKV